MYRPIVINTMSFNVFLTLKTYGGKWKEKSSRKFTPEEIAYVERAEVIESEYGNSCCFFMANGTTTYIPMDQNAKSSVGDTIDLNTAELVTLEKPGQQDILRVRG